MPFRPCRHLFTDGHQCGSPALRGELLCFNHHSARRPLQHQTIHGHTRVALPEPLDLHAVQRGLAELLRLTAAEAIDLPLAAALHRQLATAAQNLARIERSEARAEARNPNRQPVTAYTNHPTLGTIALEPQLTPTGSHAHMLTSSPAEPPTQPAPTTPGTPPDLQTQPEQNEDLETPWENREAVLEAPLPDPLHHFTLPPVIENRSSQEALATAELHYAQALETMAEGIHTRAQTRAKLHAQLFPLVDDTENDQSLLDIHPQLQEILHTLSHPDRTDQAEEPAIAPRPCPAGLSFP